MAHLETTDDSSTWSGWLADAGLDDVYYAPEYASIWAREEGGRFCGIRYQSRAGRVLYPVLLVPLDRLPGGSGLFEARTPYDFGGPRGDGFDLQMLQAEFRDAVIRWFRARGVVSEFARLHPLANAGWPPDATLHAENYVVDLRRPYEDIFESQHRRHRRAVRGFVRRSAEPLVVDGTRQDAAAFFSMYIDTMRRIGAGVEYHFSEDTIGSLVALEEMKIIRAVSAENTVGMALFLQSGHDLFYYLGASADERPPGANNAIFDAAIRHAQSHQLRMLHLGGGGESLRAFKGQLGTGTVPYRLLKRIIDPTRYAAVAEACEVSSSEQFPAFRARLIGR